MRRTLSKGGRLKARNGEESENSQQTNIANFYPMSLQDYIAQRIQDTKDSAANVMHNREEAVPVFVPVNKEEAIDRNRKEMSFYNHLYVDNMATYYTTGKNKYFLDSAEQVKAKRDYMKDEIEGIKTVPMYQEFLDQLVSLHILIVMDMKEL